MRQEHFAQHDITLEVVSATEWVKKLGLLLGRDCIKDTCEVGTLEAG
jgi:hypothetical protein